MANEVSQTDATLERTRAEPAIACMSDITNDIATAMTASTRWLVFFARALGRG